MKSEIKKDIDFVAPDGSVDESGQPDETIQWPMEVSEEEAQSQIIAALTNQTGTPVIINCRSTETEHSSRYESNFALYKIIEPIIRSKKILELFCGENTARHYFQQKQIPGESIGVDNQNPAAEIQADVAKLAESLPPQHQFDIITNLGGVDGVEDYQSDADYLTQNGLYIQGCSQDYFEGAMEENISGWLRGNEITNKSLKNFDKHFQPLTIMKINGIKQICDWPESTYMEVDGGDICIISSKKSPSEPISE